MRHQVERRDRSCSDSAWRGGSAAPPALKSLVLLGCNARLSNVVEAEHVRVAQPLEPRLPELNVGQIVGRNGRDLTFQNRVGLGEELGPLGLVELEGSLIDQGDEFLVGEVHVPVVVDEDLLVPVVGVDVVRVPAH